MAVPEETEVRPRGAIEACVRVPGSKSLSNRALITAALADGRSTLTGMLESDDTVVMGRALEQLGARVRTDEDGWHVVGVGGRPQAGEKVLDVHASGTAARFLTAIAALRPGESVVDGIARMRERPIIELAQALDALGVDVSVLGEDGCPPVRVRGGREFGGEVEVDARRSSQYVSALLLLAPYASRPVVVRLRDGELASRPYVDATIAVMRAFGANATWRDASSIAVEQGGYQPRDYAIEPDASTAAYFLVAAAISGGRVVIEGLPRDSKQADMALVPVLERMGCSVGDGSSGLALQGPADLRLRPIDVDMRDAPDAVLALAVAAAFAEGASWIRNIGHLRLKESDRLAAVETELRRLGAGCRIEQDALAITPAPMKGATIETYDDHRVAMAFALAGLRLNGVRIRNPGCVAKSWPGYFEALEQL
jgi:3-phosphoshikimate 1-carboxyvinyltransferase